MNTQEYISSGIVESYVLGLVNDQERAEFERMCAAHSEVRAAREAFEISLERETLANAVAPPKHLRSKILGEIEIEKENNRDSFINRKGVTDKQEEIEKMPVIKMSRWGRYIAAASIVLLVASTALNFYFFNQYKSVTAKYEDVVAQNAAYAQNEKDYQNTINKLSNPAMAIIKMAGDSVPSSPSPSSMATVYWDTRTKDVFLLINNMPEVSAEMQYQLWAIVDGVPVDAGVFDVAKGIVTMKNIPRAQAFAITLEKRGGSPTPQGKMYVLGKV